MVGLRVAADIAPRRGLRDVGVTITAGTNTTVVPRNDGYRITKASGGDAYNADFTSAALAGDFTMRIDYVAGDFALAGVSLTPAAGSSVAGIEYGLEYWRSGNLVYWYDNGGAISSIAMPALKRGWIKRTGNNFYLAYGGETFAAATPVTGYNPATEALGTLYADASIYSQGAVLDIRISA